MKRARTLGLATVVVVALAAAAGASSASATWYGFKASEYPASVGGVQTLVEVEGASVKQQVLTFGSREFTCEKAGLAQSLPGDSMILNLSATYSGCKSGSLPASIYMNSCKYVFAAFSGSEPYYAGGMNVECSNAGDAIELNAYKNATDQSKNVPLCSYKVGPQSDFLEGVEYRNWNTLGYHTGFTATLNVKGIKYSIATGPPLNCGVVSSSGLYVGGSRLSAPANKANGLPNELQVFGS